MNTFIIIFLTLMPHMLVAMEIQRSQDSGTVEIGVITYALSYADFKSFESNLLSSAQALLNGREEFAELRSYIQGLGAIGEQENRLSQFAYTLIDFPEEEMARLFFKAGINREALKQELCQLIMRSAHIVIYLELSALSSTCAYLKDHPLIEYKLSCFLEEAARFYRGLCKEIITQYKLPSQVIVMTAPEDSDEILIDQEPIALVEELALSKDSAIVLN